MTKTTQTPAITIADLFTVEPTYISKSGTGRTCSTIQGYKLVGPVRPGFNWHPSKRAAQEELDKWQGWATGDAEHVRGSFRADVLQWLVRILGEENAPTAFAELAQREVESAVHTEAEAARVNEQAELSARVREALAAAGFTAAEIDRVSVKVVER